MKYKYLVFTFCLYFLFLFSACKRDLTFDFPAKEPLLSVESINDPHVPFHLILTMTKSPMKPLIVMKTDCSVDLYENDLLFTTLILDTSFFKYDYYDYSFLKFNSFEGYDFSEGKNYKVEINYPGFEPVSATTNKPEVVKIKSVSFKRVTGEMPRWFYETPRLSNYSSDEIRRDTSHMEFEITIDDPPDKTNFYRIGINCIIISSQTNFYYDRRIQYASSDDPDPIFMSYLDHTEFSWEDVPFTWDILWDDIKFNGKEHTFKILAPWVYYSSGIELRYIITLYSLSEDYYRHMTDRWKYKKSKNDPFAEPIKFYSNVSNGCGIFAFSSVDTDTIYFHPDM